ncbi:MAG: LPS assembly protein LptD [Vibrio sp.]
MLPTFRTFLATLISAALLPTALANESSNDSVPEVPPVDQCIVSDNSEQDQQSQPVNIEADSLSTEGTNAAVYSGGVIVTQGNKKIQTDKLTVNQEENSIVADGNVTMYDGQIKANSTKVKSDLKGDQMEFHNSDYKLLCETARGDAAYILKTGQKIYNIEDGTLTTCPEDNKSWRIKATDIDIDKNEEEATFWNTRFELLNIPVFYWPYVTVPIGNKRKTGFLYPSASYDDQNGLEINVPIYFNLHPQFDLTTTVEYKTRRGTLLDNQFRYLTDGFGEGSIDFEYLHHDSDPAPTIEDKDRWGFNYEHDGIYDRNWKIEIDYSKVSDDEYLDDNLGSNIGDREDGNLLQKEELSYRTDFSDTILRFRDFQVLGNGNAYRLMPQLEYKYARQVVPNLDVSLDSHISRFETDATNTPDATRVHIEPGFAVPLHAPWGELTSEAKLMYTYYDQDLKNDHAATSNGHELSENATRVVPKYRINGSIFLDNNEKWLGGYTQALEPRIQYLYVPHVNQDDIYTGYDTTRLQQDYTGLFRDTQYSGVDYIAEMNQFSYGVTSRFYDESYKERFNVSIGQILYLDPNSDDVRRGDDDGSNNVSAWALENEWNISDSLFFSGGLQYDGNVGKLQQGDATLEYRAETGGYIQTNYRYVSDDYITENDINTNAQTINGISQVGALTGFKLSDRWDVRASYYHDITEGNMLESLVGVTYNDDCWFLGLTFSRHIINPRGEDGYDKNHPELSLEDPFYDEKFSINFGLKGLGQSMAAATEDGGNAIGMNRPFSLN